MEPREGLSGAARLLCRLFGLAVGLVYVTRLWFLLIPAVLLTVGCWRCRISKKRREQAVDAESVLPHAALPDPYQRICADITKQLRTVNPEAKWVWERPDARAALFAGEHVRIRCNRACGYRNEPKLISKPSTELMYMLNSVPTGNDFLIMCGKRDKNEETYKTCLERIQLSVCRTGSPGV